MSYKVIRSFKDLNDPEKHDYVVGDSFPREGHDPSEEFISSLLTGYNSAGSIFIAVADEQEVNDEEKVDDKEEVDEKTPETSEDVSEEPAKEDAIEEEVTSEEAAEKPKRKRKAKKDED
ncbi:hypothetical protein [Streptococcus anginosus]|uniref:hypothetical protein n=1 Tax=Streptococcus anginosus TaxID=1328 RepID=UPI00321BD8A6